MKGLSGKGCEDWGGSGSGEGDEENCDDRKTNSKIQLNRRKHENG